MVEQARNGTSINHQELSEVDQSTNLLKFITPENPTTCTTTQPTQDGGRCGSITKDTFTMLTTVRYSQLRIRGILKLNQFG
jgi:hypothetical protein